jgi:hypothetical protein
VLAVVEMKIREVVRLYYRTMCTRVRKNKRDVTKKMGHCCVSIEPSRCFSLRWTPRVKLCGGDVDGSYSIKEVYPVDVLSSMCDTGSAQENAIRLQLEVSVQYNARDE